MFYESPPAWPIGTSLKTYAREGGSTLIRATGKGTFACMTKLRPLLCCCSDAEALRHVCGQDLTLCTTDMCYLQSLLPSNVVPRHQKSVLRRHILARAHLKPGLQALSKPYVG